MSSKGRSYSYGHPEASASVTTAPPLDPAALEAANHRGKLLGDIARTRAAIAGEIAALTKQDGDLEARAKRIEAGEDA